LVNTLLFPGIAATLVQFDGRPEIPHAVPQAPKFRGHGPDADSCMHGSTGTSKVEKAVEVDADVALW